MERVEKQRAKYGAWQRCHATEESSEGRMADALALGGDEGCDKLRKAAGRRK